VGAFTLSSNRGCSQKNRDKEAGKDRTGFRSGKTEGKFLRQKSGETLGCNILAGLYHFIYLSFSL